MKHRHEPVCPGCGKHCPMSHPRCRYGRTYFARLNAPAPEHARPRHKWEAFVTRDEPIWLLLDTARSLRKALKKERVTEAQLLDRLSDDEQLRLTALLRRLAGAPHVGPADSPEKS